MAVRKYWKYLFYKEEGILYSNVKNNNNKGQNVKLSL
jgi:hypothetical protein